MAVIEGVLCDIDGVLVTSWEPLPGAPEAIATLRARGIPFRLLTNTTTRSQVQLAADLWRAGFHVAQEDIVTAPVATASYLRSVHEGKT